MAKTDWMYVIHIETTPEKLFCALKDGEFTKQYWGGTVLETDWKKGSALKILGRDGKVSATGEVKEIDPPKLLSYTFNSERFKNPEPTTVTFKLQPMGQNVRLQITHSGLEAGSPMFGAVTEGWAGILSNLKTLLERGRPLVYPEWG